MINRIETEHFMQRVANASRLLVNGRFTTVLDEIRRQMNSESLAYGLRRDISRDFVPPVAKINFTIRHFINSDGNSLFENHSKDPAEERAISDQRGIINAGIPGCYVAVTEDGQPCYMQWLISSQYNDMIANHFRGLFPFLTRSEALLEGAYTPPRFRGMGIMPAAMAQIASLATGINASQVNTFVDINNIASLKGCRRAGFEPYILRRDKWFLFRRNITFETLPAELLERYHKNTGDKPRA